MHTLFYTLLLTLASAQQYLLQVSGGTFTNSYVAVDTNGNAFATSDGSSAALFTLQNGILYTPDPSGNPGFISGSSGTQQLSFISASVSEFNFAKDFNGNLNYDSKSSFAVCPGGLAATNAIGFVFDTIPASCSPATLALILLGTSSPAVTTPAVTTPVTSPATTAFLTSPATTAYLSTSSLALSTIPIGYGHFSVSITIVIYATLGQFFPCDCAASSTTIASGASALITYLGVVTQIYGFGFIVPQVVTLQNLAVTTITFVPTVTTLTLQGAATTVIAPCTTPITSTITVQPASVSVLAKPTTTCTPATVTITVCSSAWVSPVSIQTAPVTLAPACVTCSVISVAVTSVAPTSVLPASVVPASVVPASVVPASVAPASVAPASVAPASVLPASVQTAAVATSVACTTCVAPALVSSVLPASSAAAVACTTCKAVLAQNNDARHLHPSLWFIAFVLLM